MAGNCFRWWFLSIIGYIVITFCIEREKTSAIAFFLQYHIFYHIPHDYRDNKFGLDHYLSTFRKENPSLLSRKSNGLYSNSLPSTPKSKNRLVLPLIGPIFNAPPLLMGADTKLNPPTPLQWKAFQECVLIHQQYTKNDSMQNEKQELNSSVAAVISAAPLILLIDEKTGQRQVPIANSQTKESGRYATIAAIVGINENSKKKRKEEDFTEYYNDYKQLETGSLDIDPLESSVRLVAVGRAVLKDYFYRVPSIDTDSEEEENFMKDEFHDENDDGYLDKTPIVMAEFEPIVDDDNNGSLYSNKFTENKNIGNKGVRSARSSPVHSLSKLHQIFLRVDFMHADRRRLVAGLTAAKARLHLSRLEQLHDNTSQNRDDDPFIQLDDFDYDGIGLIAGGGDGEAIAPSSDASVFEATNDDINSSNSDRENIEVSVSDFLKEFQGERNSKNIKHDPSLSIFDSKIKDVDEHLDRVLEKLESMENYGVNYYGAFSSIASLTKVALKLFEPYYSEIHRDREEFEVEVSSFVAFRALEGYATPKDIVWALQCTSSRERMERAYQIMIDHRIKLRKLAERISDELRECGEECTDLW